MVLLQVCADNLISEQSLRFVIILVVTEAVDLKLVLHPFQHGLRRFTDDIPPVEVNAALRRLVMDECNLEANIFFFVVPLPPIVDACGGP